MSEQVNERTTLTVVETPPEATVEELQARVNELETSLVEAGRTMIEFRAKVRTEAMAMAQAHNLCPVVEQTLHKVGIDIERVTVEYVTTIERIARYEFPKELADALNDAQMLRWLSHKTIPAAHSQRDFRAVKALLNDEHPVGDPVVRTVAQAPKEKRMRNRANGIPAGYMGAYASDDGRTLHLLPNPNETVFESNAWGQYEGLQGRFAACGSPGSWRQHSARGQGRICERCRTRLGIR